MATIKTLALVGGISSGSLNKKYYRSIVDMGLADFEFETFDISKLPFFSQDLENDPPDVVTEFKDKIREAEAILFITPEYNSSFPGVLKNAIDWGSRPYGTNLWNHKPAAILGASPGNAGTFGAQNHLRQTLSYLNMSVMGQPQIYFGQANKYFNEEDKLVNDKTKELLTNFFKSFSNWVKQFRQEEEIETQKHSFAEDHIHSPSTH